MSGIVIVFARGPRQDGNLATSLLNGNVNNMLHLSNGECVHLSDPRPDEDGADETKPPEMADEGANSLFL